MSLKQILIFLCLLTFQFAGAVVKDVSVDSNTVSATDITRDPTTSAITDYVLFAGYSGGVGECQSPAAPTTAVCNACTALNLCGGSPIYQCAQRSINPQLLLTVTMTLDTLPTTPHLGVQWAGNATSDLSSDATVSPTTFAANQSMTIQIPWSKVCNAAGLGVNCDAGGVSGGASGSLSVGLTDGGSAFATGNFQKFTVKISYAKPDDALSLVAAPTQSPASGEPFTDFRVTPGDGKVFVDDIFRNSVGVSGGSGVKWQSLRVYYGTFTAVPTNTTPNFCDIPLSDNYSDLNVEDKTSIASGLSDNKVTGLTNEQLYMFNIATVDESTIVSGFITPSALTNLAVADKIRYVSQPGEVVGLLNNKKCFIATAAFGSQMDPQVELLRQFRNKVLIPTEWGRKFVRTYYKYSPPAAEFIAQHDELRAMVRGALWPLIIFAELSLRFGLFLTFGLFTLALLSLILLARQLRRPI